MGVSLKSPFFWGGAHKKPIWKIHFWGEGLTKNQYIGGNCLKRGAWTFCRFEGRLGEEGGGVFLGGGRWYPNAHYTSVSRYHFHSFLELHSTEKIIFIMNFPFLSDSLRFTKGMHPYSNCHSEHQLTLGHYCTFIPPLGLGLTGLQLVLSHISLRVIDNKRGGGGYEKCNSASMSG